MHNTINQKQGWNKMAEKLQLEAFHHGAYAHYKFPNTWENGWITEVYPMKGLAVASAWFQSREPIEYNMHFEQPGLLIFCIDTGNITIKQQGKKTKILRPFTQLISSNGKTVKILIPANEHICFTSLVIYDRMIKNFLSSNHIHYPICLNDAKKWKSNHIDTPLAMLIMEQIRWGIRGNRIPLPAYLCKTIELLCLFAHNAKQQKQQKQNRRYYVTWENEQKLYRVKEYIDSNPLLPIIINELCALAEMSESKLRIAFKSYYNQSLYAYIRETIMKRAMQMLGNDELSIKNIAAACGYKNSAKFTAAFKNVHGITPSDFRKGFGL